MRSILLAACAAALPLGFAPPASAQPDDPAVFAFGVGIFDVLQDDGNRAVNFNLEYRGERFAWAVKPLVGIGVTTDVAAYFYAGIALDFLIGDHFAITPSFAPSIYLAGDDGKDLGFPIEFRSGIEVSWRFDDSSRLGVAIHHLSNASLGDENPGTETLNVYYATPLPYFLGQ